MMTSRKMNFPAKEMDAIEIEDGQYPDSEIMPPEEESDTVSVLLQRIAGHGNHGSARFAYPDQEVDDYSDKQELHRMVEDLQFGHDLRL